MTVKNTEHAKKAFRMFPYFWMEDDLFAATRDGLVRDRAVVDEITLFCDHMHMAYMPDDMLNSFTSVLTKRIKELKSLGFPSVGINMLQTVGHGDFHADLLPKPPMATPVDWKGNTSAVQLCPRSEEFKKFTFHKYAEYAKCGPDFIWVDDDFRVPDKNVSYTCFCDDCIAKFNALHGYSYDRETLVKELDRPGDDPVGQKLRLQWSEYNLKAYEDTMAVIREAVNSVDPKIKLGLMIVHLAAQEYILSDYTGMAKELGAEMLRPGGGFHHEGNLRELFAKAAGVMGQVDQIPDVADTQYEFEGFPQNYYKSGKVIALESTTALMCGCNGIAFASLPPDNGAEREMATIAAHADMWDDMVRRTDGWKLYGGRIVQCRNYAVNCDSGHYFSKAAHSFFNVLTAPFSSGFISMTPCEENSVLDFITEDMAASMTEEELKEVFSKGVMLDGPAAEILIAQGHGDLIGCKKANYIPDHSAEKYLPAGLNGRIAGTYRYMYTTGAEQTYSSNSAGVPPMKHFLGLYNFDLMDGAEPLSESYNVRHEAGGIASYVYENSLGGRVAVFGYLPWSYFGVWQRYEQTTAIVDWLTKGKLPVKVMNGVNVASFLKQPEDRSKFMLELVNAFVDDTPESLEVRILGEFGGAVSYYDEKGAKHALPSSAICVKDGFTTLALPGMTGWGHMVIFSE